MKGVTFSAPRSTVAYEGTRLAGVPCLGRKRLETVAAFLHETDFGQLDVLLVATSSLHVDTVPFQECEASLCQEDLACQNAEEQLVLL